jgi:hypothetical protein
MLGSLHLNNQFFLKTFTFLSEAKNQFAFGINYLIIVFCFIQIEISVRIKVLPSINLSMFISMPAYLLFRLIISTSSFENSIQAIS